MFLSVIVLLLIFISIAKTYRKRRGKAPKGLQSVIEPLIIFVRDEIARPNIGHQYHRFMPLLLTIFFFIWINNLLGLIPFFPGGANVSGNIAFPRSEGHTSELQSLMRISYAVLCLKKKKKDKIKN